MIKERISALKHDNKGKAQFMRFVLNGCLAAGVHYGVYFLLQLFAEVNLSYAAGYIVSFAVNFYFTCRFTFRTEPSWARFAGFSGSHAVNFGLHIVLFWCCMQLGVHRLVAPVIVMGIAMLVQFTILRLVFQAPLTPPERGDVSRPTLPRSGETEGASGGGHLPQKKNALHILRNGKLSVPLQCKDTV